MQTDDFDELRREAWRLRQENAGLLVEYEERLAVQRGDRPADLELSLLARDLREALRCSVEGRERLDLDLASARLAHRQRSAELLAEVAAAERDVALQAQLLQAERQPSTSVDSLQAQLLQMREALETTRGLTAQLREELVVAKAEATIEEQPERFSDLRREIWDMRCDLQALELEDHAAGRPGAAPSRASLEQRDAELLRTADALTLRSERAASELEDLEGHRARVAEAEAKALQQHEAAAALTSELTRLREVEGARDLELMAAKLRVSPLESEVEALRQRYAGQRRLLAAYGAALQRPVRRLVPEALGAPARELASRCGSPELAAFRLRGVRNETDGMLLRLALDPRGARSGDEDWAPEPTLLERLRSLPWEALGGPQTAFDAVASGEGMTLAGFLGLCDELHGGFSVVEATQLFGCLTESPILSRSCWLEAVADVPDGNMLDQNF